MLLSLRAIGSTGFPSVVHMSQNKAKKAIPREEIPWNPTVIEEKCTGCGTCVEFCQHGVYELQEDKAAVVNPTECIVGCTGCLSKCPEGAISFPDQKEFIEKMRKLRARYS